MYSMSDLEYYFSNERKHTPGFYISLGLVFLFMLMRFGIEVDEFVQRKDISLPDWFFYLQLLIDIESIASLILVILFKKIGVFGFIIGVLFHFFSNLFWLSTFLYTDIMILFLFSGLSMVFIIPKWKKYFK